jgi:hypothetical protein
VELYWQGETEKLEISHELGREQTWASAVGSRRLTTSAMPRNLQLDTDAVIKVLEQGICPSECSMRI